METQQLPPVLSRRRVLINFLKGTITVTAVALVYPLLRFTGFTVRPKPRYITVNKKLPVGTFHADRDFLLIMLEEGPVAVSRRCTHLGCRVNYRLELNIIECPCHQSRFSPQGHRTAGPAKENLQQYKVALVEDEQGQTTGYVVTI